MNDSTRTPRLWLRRDVTLVSSLTEAEACARLQQILPRFAVPSGVAVPRLGFTSSRYYLGALSDRSFMLNGPYGGRKTALSVQGELAAGDGGDTRIRLSARPAQAILGWFLLVASGLLAGGLFAALERTIVFPLGLLVVFCTLSVAYFALASASAAHRLGELAICLAEVLEARESDSL